MACVTLLSACLLCPGLCLAGGALGLSGQVTDPDGLPVAQAQVRLLSAQGTVLLLASTNREGGFEWPQAPAGQHLLEVQAPGFRPVTKSVAVSLDQPGRIAVQLEIAPSGSALTVTARRGVVLDSAEAAEITWGTDREDLAPPLATLGHALEGGPSVLVQQTTRGQSSPFLRGFTGQQVLHLIDGVRFNNSTFRFGPNQYFSLLEPSQAQRVEIALGPAGARYGSDGLGGVVQVLTPAAPFTDSGRWQTHGRIQAFAATADSSAGASAEISSGKRMLAWLAGGSARRHGDLRAGRATDSHHALRRFFELRPEQIRSLLGGRMLDTGYEPRGAYGKWAARLPRTQSVTLWYQRSEVRSVRSYKDLWGGQGRLQADFAPQDLDFFYVRYEKHRLTFLDSLAATFSLNSQRDGLLSRRLRLEDSILRDRVRVDAYGYTAQAHRSLGPRAALAFGAELFRERLHAARTEINPAGGATTVRRALYPNGSLYRTGGLFSEAAVERLSRRLRASVGGRLTRAKFQTFALRNRTPSGELLGVPDSAQTFGDATFHAGLTFGPAPWARLHAVVSRGFRAPNANDLGGLGLNDLGFEIPADLAARASAWVGADSGEAARPTGARVRRLVAERLFNYELGFGIHTGRFDFRTQAFAANLHEAIARRTLLFDASLPPETLAGFPVRPLPGTPVQQARGLVPVATSLDPRAVKAFVNSGKQRYWGWETVARWRPRASLQAQVTYSFLAGRELDPPAPVRRLPPQQGRLDLSYIPRGRPWWTQLVVRLAGPQRRLNPGDLADERIGAARSRLMIADFFFSARLAPFLAGGPDGQLRFHPTQETLRQIQDRVLPGVADSLAAPLYRAAAGYAVLDWRGGLRLSERSSLTLTLGNLADRNYRVHGSGVDAPGFDAAVGYTFTF